MNNIIESLQEIKVYYFYEYYGDYHNGKVEVLPKDLELAMVNIVRPAKEQGRKVIITDENDDCVFHMEQGKILFPTELKDL